MRVAMDVEAEIRDLKRRVGELEGGFGFMTQQVQAVHRDLLGFQEQTDQRFDKVDRQFDKIDDRFGKVEGRLDRVESEVRGLKVEVRQLREELPSVVGDVMREVLREQKA
jgi:archaellum component FlaC